MIKEIARVISRLFLSVILYSIWLIVYRMKIVGKNKEETEDLINEKIKIEIEKLIND